MRRSPKEETYFKAVVAYIHPCMQDCRAELHGLLKEEKLAGASLLILANKQDVPGALSAQQIEQARFQDTMLMCMPQSILAECSLPCAHLKLASASSFVNSRSGATIHSFIHCGTEHGSRHVARRLTACAWLASAHGR